MSEVRIVNRGVDTLVVNVYYIDQERPLRREIYVVSLWLPALPGRRMLLVLGGSLL
jgi:hypothetical protein